MNNIQYPSLFTKLQFLTDTVEFGSRPLGITKQHSDYDLAILLTPSIKESLDTMQSIHIYSVETYFNTLPTHKAYLYKITEEGFNNLDILALTYKDDLNAIDYTMQEIKKYHKMILQQKDLRISIFEQLLIHYGWEDLNKIYLDQCQKILI